jgi:outer membrane lipoprotein SlyB
MRYILAAAIITLSISPAVHAKGCIKGAIVGGVAGSAVGHGKLGAAAGCAVGHHEANKADSQKNAPQTNGQAK